MACGGSEFFTNLAVSTVGRYRGGPAKVAVILYPPTYVAERAEALEQLARKQMALADRSPLPSAMA